MGMGRDILTLFHYLERNKDQWVVSHSTCCKVELSWDWGESGWRESPARPFVAPTSSLTAVGVTEKSNLLASSPNSGLNLSCT